MRDILLILLPILSALASSYITYIFSRKGKKEEAIQKFKQEKYEKLLYLLQGFLGQTASDDIKVTFFDEYYKSWLYASEEVIVKINNMINLVKGEQTFQPETGRKAIAEIVLAIRKDLGRKTRLNSKYFTYIDVIKRNINI